MRRWLVFASCAASLAAAAADIGGWMEQQARAGAQRDDCAALPAQAARTPRHAPGAADLYYASGLCYLFSPKLARDPVAARAWLVRAAEADHPLARRALVELERSMPP